MNPLKIKPFIALNLFLLSLAFTSHASGSTCYSLLTNKPSTVEVLDEVFRTEYYNDKTYVDCGHCHSGVATLLRAFQRRLPEIKSEDFKFLYISSPLWTEEHSRKNGVYVNKPRMSFKKNPNGTIAGWKFHVVLQYKNRIYDMDYLNTPTPMDQKSYLNDFFLDQETVDNSNGRYQYSKDQLSVFVIPGEHYMSIPLMELYTLDFHINIVNDFEPIPLATYLGGLN